MDDIDAKAEKIVLTLIEDLAGRSGLGDVLDGLDIDIREEIEDTWREHVVSILSEKGSQ